MQQMVSRCSASHYRVHTFALFFPNATAAWNAHWKKQQIFFASKAGSDMKNNQRTAQNTDRHSNYTITHTKHTHTHTHTHNLTTHKIVKAAANLYLSVNHD